MPYGDRRPILSGMNSPPDPQRRPDAPDGFGHIASGMTALVAKRILEANDDAMTATKAPADPAARRAHRKNPARSRPTRPAQSTAEDALPTQNRERAACPQANTHEPR